MRRYPLVGVLVIGMTLGSAAPVSAERYQPLPVESRQAGDTQYQPVPTPNGGVQQPIVPANVQWELYSQLQQMQDELQRLRGMVEEQAYKIEQINRQQRERYIDLDQRISKLGSAAASTPTTIPASAGAGQHQAIDEKATYDQAIVLMRERKFSESIQLLENLLVAHPQGGYAGNAQYWLGELYMANTPRQADTAKGHFVRLLSQFPEHAKVPDALFKLGTLYQEEGEKQRARVTFEKLVKEYASHPSARMARDALGKL